MNNRLFSPYKIKNLTINNRIVRSATYEGRSDFEGNPLPSMIGHYEELAKNEIGLIITGFNFTSKYGRAIQPRQASISSPKQIDGWKKVTQRVHEYAFSKIFMQISHCGRQTLRQATRHFLYAPSKKMGPLFNQRPIILNKKEIQNIVSEYALCALHSRQAGFDGVQIHGAHGYLIHQFLSPYFNKRTDQYGGSYENRFRFLNELLSEVKKECGIDYPISVKLNLADDLNYTLDDLKSYLPFINNTNFIDAIELSYGTMDYPFNIFRGSTPIELAYHFSPLLTRYHLIFRKWAFMLAKKNILKKNLPFQNNYNFELAKSIPSLTHHPLILTGGIRNVDDIGQILTHGFSAVSLSRPLIREPDFIKKMRYNLTTESKCINCNLCAVHCDSIQHTKCRLIA